MRIDWPRERDDETDSPEEIERQDADLPVFPLQPADRAETAAEYRAKVDAEYRSYAIDKGCERVEEIEKNVVSPAMRRIEAEDPDRHLVGFDHRLKGKDRIEEKVSHDMEKRGVSAEQAFGTLKDAIRYTFQYADNKYVDGVQTDVDRLKTEGFELVDFRNTWSNEEYKGVNSRWRVPDSGQLFEVQFHTEASFNAKQETHAAYERLRTLPHDHAEVRALREYQREVTAKIPIPPHVQDLMIRKET